MLNIFDGKIHFLSMKRLYLAAVRHTRQLRPGMRIVFRWDSTDVNNDDPEWGRVLLVEHTHTTISKLVIHIDTAYEVDGVMTDKVVYYVKNKEYATHWCIYDVEDEDIDMRESFTNILVSLADGNSDIYTALLQHEFELM